MTPQELTSDTYKDVIGQSTGILLSHKPACPHCKNMKIVISKFQKKQGPVDILLLDTQAYPEAMENLGIERVPTLLFINKGKIEAKKAGLMNPKELAALYKEAMSK